MENLVEFLNDRMSPNIPQKIIKNFEKLLEQIIFQKIMILKKNY